MIDNQNSSSNKKDNKNYLQIHEANIKIFTDVIP